MNFKLITLDGVKVDEPVYEVIIPTTTGVISVFPSHEPLVTVAAPGVVAVRHDKRHSDDELEYFAISGGAIDIDRKSVRILVDEAERGDDIIEAETQAALDRAIKMRDEAKSMVDLDKAHELVDRQKVRLKVADLQRRKKRR